MFNLLQALHCAKCGFTDMWHNEIRDTFAMIMLEVCYDVEFEPTLKLLQGESFIQKTLRTGEKALLDIKANGL